MADTLIQPDQTTDLAMGALPHGCGVPLFIASMGVLLVIFMVASTAPGMWPDPIQLIVAGAAAGVGAAFVMPATLPLLTSAHPKAQRTRATGVMLLALTLTAGTSSFWASPGRRRS